MLDFKSRKITRKKNGWAGKPRRKTISIKHKILHKKVEKQISQNILHTKK